MDFADATDRTRDLNPNGVTSVPWVHQQSGRNPMKRTPRETVAFFASYFGWGSNAPTITPSPAVLPRDGEPSPRNRQIWRALLRATEPEPARASPGDGGPRSGRTGKP
jgi:hypothetical protein